MKFISSLALISIIFLCAGCPEDTDPADSEILIVNLTNEDIVHYIELKSVNDTSLLTIAFPLTPDNTETRVIGANDSVALEEGFRRIVSNNSDKALMLYLFSRDTIEQVPWDRIVDEYLVLRRYDLTLEDSEAMDWRIKYP